MSFAIRNSHNGKCHEVYAGDITLLFSYETLVGFAVPGFGRVSSENVWGPTTGKHINGWPARYQRIDREVFKKAEVLLNAHLSGSGTRKGLIGKLERLFKGLEPTR